MQAGGYYHYLFIHIQRGFHTEGWGAWNFPPSPQPQFSLPRNLEIEYGYYISYLHVTECISMCHQSVWKFCPRLHQKQFERYINSKFSWGGGMPPYPPSRHACVLHTTILFPPPPNSKSCMKPCHQTFHTKELYNVRRIIA